MFSNKTAWFSESCSKTTSDIWIQNGGKLEKVSIAQFVFSDDWECQDTKSLLSSDAYLQQHLAVFSSQYVTDAAMKGINNVVFGEYHLLPDFIKQKGQISGGVRGGSRRCSTMKAVTPDPRRGHRNRSDKSLDHLQNQSEASSSTTASSQSSSVQPSELIHLNVTKMGPNRCAQDIFASSSQIVCQSEEPHSAIILPSPIKRRRQNKEANTRTHKATLPCSSLANAENIPHVKDLPKYIGPLKTVNPRDDNVEIVPIILDDDKMIFR